jgi:pimeloyl-ACP methyl ester carboxylesterase
MTSSYIPSYHDLEVTFSVPKTSTTSKAIVHYVQAGNPKLPTVLLLHGFPTSSHQYRDFIPMLSDSYHVLAPDYPGFGLTKVSDDFVFNFENITSVMAAWVRALDITEAAIYIQDFGAPVGLRLAITNGIKPTAIISQNGNTYHEGLGQELFAPLVALWNTGSAEARKMIADNMLTLEGTREHIIMGTPDKDLHLIDPQAWTFAYLQNIAGPVNATRQLDMLYDYRTNVELYPTFQKYIRDSKVPILAVWGKGDPAFIPAGAEAYRTDSPDATVHLLDAGHFALETARWEVARIMRQFLTKVLKEA